MTRSSPLYLLAVSALVALVASLAPKPGEARPGGGSTFRGSSTSRSSSGSSSRSSSSSGSSSRSSSSTRSTSTSRSSSGSSSKSRSSSTPLPVVYSYRLESGRTRASHWTPAAGSLYGVTPPRPDATRVAGASERTDVIYGLGFLGVLGMVVFVMLVGGVALAVVALRRPSGWSTRASRATARPEVVRPRQALEAIKQFDPDFSAVLFEDFLYALYAEAHSARGTARLAQLAPYLRPGARDSLLQPGNAPVSTIVIGAMRFVEVNVDAASGSRVVVEFETNYTESAPNLPPQSYYSRERWTLVRGPQARSRPPERVRVFACPNCGAPLDRQLGSQCGYCQQVVDTGAFDWVLEQLVVLEREARPPMLVGDTAEAGTQLPTVYDPQLSAAKSALALRDPSFQEPQRAEQALFARLGLIFATMQAAWSSLEWQHARPFLSDNLWQSQSYWLEAYRRAGLRNVTENARIVGVELVRLASDRWYDAVTIRVHASGLDYTFDASGRVVGGSRERERPYSEYWTLIRSSNATGFAKSDPTCPGCGGPLAINMAGECSHCRAKVSSGRFDWVLSRIEQDETYQS